MLSLATIAAWLNCDFSAQDVRISGVSIDSRTTKAGELFIAIQGARYDGHAYVEHAIAAGAVAILAKSGFSYTGVPVLTVDDTQQGLMALAAAWRQYFTLPIVAITGSCGKTSTRGLLQTILSGVGDTLASEKSYNNHIGVPLTLLRLRDHHQYAVVEVGTDHAGEIAALVHVVRPHVAILTHVGPAHLGNFGSVESIAQEKSQIFSVLDVNGIRILNADNAYHSIYSSVGTERHTLSFGLSDRADVRATDIQALPDGSRFVMSTPCGRLTVHFPLLGQHQIYNALAAAAAALALNISLDHIQQGLESATPQAGRVLPMRGVNGALIIDDSYNANPASLQAAITLLVQQAGMPILVVGDMLGLGEHANGFHQELGRFAKKAGVAHLFCYGEHTAVTATVFGERARHFSDQSALLADLLPLLDENAVVLVKGSNAMEMNKLVEALQ